jgi:sulfoxide reductase heme-binding subunit YedZ
MYRVSIFFGLLIPFFVLAVQVFVNEVNDPIKYMYTFTGTTAIVLVFFTITISMIKKIINLMKYRRMIGLYAFFYALLHFLVFFILDAQLDLIFVVEESLDKPFVYLGMIAFGLLLFMAITSTKKLFKRYNKYHSAIYIVAIITTIHFIMAQKSLSGEQLTYLLVILVIGCFKFLQKNKSLNLKKISNMLNIKNLIKG